MLITDNKIVYNQCQNKIMAAKRKKLRDMLQTAMERRAITPADLARRVGVNRASISRILSGDTSPKPETALLIARALDLAPADVLEAAGHIKLAAEHRAAEEDLTKEYDRLMTKLRALNLSPSEFSRWSRFDQQVAINQLRTLDAIIERETGPAPPGGASPGSEAKEDPAA